VNDDDLLQWLRLLSCGIDRPALVDLIRRYEHPEVIFSLPEAALSEEAGLSARQREGLGRLASRDVIRRQLSLMRSHEIELLTVVDERFPKNLNRMRVPPPAVFVRGEIQPCDSLAVGIVGPRAATPYGLEVARRFCRDFAPHLTVISGAALGIDTAAHEATLENGGRTIGVLGCGIDVNYPAPNAALRKRITEGNGALLSIFAPGTPPLRGHFPTRNFILAGLALAVVVVEASARSGALVTARAAGEEGRPVYAVPGDITRKNSEGSNALLRDGATALSSAAELLADLDGTLMAELKELNLSSVRPNSEGRAEPIAREPQPSLPFAESALLQEIRHHPVSFDDLHDRLVPDRMSFGELSSSLLMLEMKGLVQQMPGRVYAPRL